MVTKLSIKKKFWLSDLHLFARRSSGDDYIDTIFSAAKQADVFVFGGDIFDFSWSIRESVESSVEEAVAWISRLVRHAPNCHFHFLLGNHDFHQLFINQLVMLEKNVPNFQWHAFVLRIEETMFLHGDAADFGMNVERLAQRRSRWLAKPPKKRIWHELYDLAVAFRLHRFVSTVVYRDQWVARRLLAYLNEMGHGPETGLQHVYFGHTHVPMPHYELEGVRFHNGGAPLKGLQFQILEPIINSK